MSPSVPETVGSPVQVESSNVVGPLTKAMSIVISLLAAAVYEKLSPLLYAPVAVDQLASPVIEASSIKTVDGREIDSEQAPSGQYLKQR